VTAPSPAPGGPVVLVTGATGGIGAATVREYARRGARLVLLARSTGLLETLRAEVEATGAQALVTVADVTDAGAVDRAFGAATERFGRIDVVVHTAAVVSYGRLDEVPADVFEQIIRVNVVGTANVARAAMAGFTAAGGGSLLLVGSVLGHVTVPLMGSYTTSKWAVRGLVRVLQQEARSLPGVRVAVVDPGSIATPMYTLAANYAGRMGRPPPPVVTAEAVGREILRVVERGGKRRGGVNPANLVMKFGFVAMPRLYDVLVTPLMRLAAMRRQQVAPHPGNVFTPSEQVRVPSDGPPPWPGRSSMVTVLHTGVSGDGHRGLRKLVEELAGNGPRG
jgi:NAD(P)-dependent dehydrogenase (short-subunit alcohol dehydrogenase family)